jgi:sugar phosphate permease
MMTCIFVGYASFYLVRSNFPNAKPYLESELGFTKSQVGLIAAMLSISYGLSKFVMGSVSDRSNPRFFMATGLICSGLVNLLMGAWPTVGLLAPSFHQPHGRLRGALVERWGWTAGVLLLVGACVAATICPASAWNMHQRAPQRIIEVPVPVETR